MADVRLVFDQAALKALDNRADIERFVGDLGQQVADRANARAATLFTDRGGGGVGSIESHVVHDEKGTYARVAYPPEHWEMWIHEVGSIHERPRPHVRPALYGTKKATGGKDSAIRGVKSSKAATATTRKNRAAATARRTVKKGK